MSLYWDINPFSVLKYLINGKAVYYHRHVRKKGFMPRCKLINPCSVYYYSDFFLA
jgi:hypothetical protein